MTIRRQILFFILPLFLGFGVLSGVFSCWFKLTEARDAFADGSTALALTAAEFIEPADLAALRDGIPLERTRLGPVLVRLERWALVRRFYLLDTASGKVLADIAPAGTPVATAAEIAALKPGEIDLLPLRITADGQSRQPALAFTAARGAILGIETSAEDYLESRREIYRSALSYGIRAFVVGLALAWWIGTMLHRQMRRLQLTAQAIGAPAFAATGVSDSVSEVADLASTFGVMHSVNEETVDRTRRSLVDTDYYRGERALTETFHAAFSLRAAWSGATIDAAWLPVGVPPPAALAGAVATGPDSGVAFAGIAGPVGDLAAALRARAATRYLAEGFALRPAAAVAAEALALFTLNRLELVVWTPAGLTRWNAAHDAPAAPVAWDGKPVALTCLGPINAERLDLYLVTFPARPASAALDDLPALLDAQEPGVVLVLRRAT